MLLRGWREIAERWGRSERTTRLDAIEYGMPVIYVRGRVQITTKAFLEWLQEFQQKKQEEEKGAREGPRYLHR